MSFSRVWSEFFDRQVPNLVLRLLVLMLGTTCIAFGVALSRETGIGTSPISCIPAVLSFATDFTVGQYTFVMNAAFVVVQILLLRRRFKLVQLLQLPFVFVFSVIIDFFTPFCQTIPMDIYPAQLGFLVLSLFITALGVFLEVKASLVVLPGEGIVLAIATVTGIEFPKCKVAFDTTNVLVGVIISLVSMGGLVGVREGTIIAALSIGTIVRLYGKLMPNFKRFVPTEGKITLTPQN